MFTEVTTRSTIVLTHMYKLEKRSWQIGCSSFCSCSTVFIRIATFASRCLQEIGNFRFARLLSGQGCSAKSFKTVSHARICSFVVLGFLVGFAASNLSRSLESRRFEYSVVCSYIIPNLAVIS